MRTRALGLLAAGPGAVSGLGVPVALLLLVPMEAGVPIPIPADLLMLLIGERAADGSFPLWAAVLALEVVAVVGTAALFAIARGPGHALVERLGPRVGLTRARLDRANAVVARRGRGALVVGRGTPGLRTVTVIAAGGSGLSMRRALPALAIGASIFLQLHLALGYFLGPAARDALDAAKGPAIVGLAVVVLAALAFWFVRRGRRAGTQSFSEAACPLCLALAWTSDRAGRVSGSENTPSHTPGGLA